MTNRIGWVVGIGAVALVGACSTSSGTANDAARAGADTSTSNQTPPMGREAVEAWLAGGAYRSWHCEPSVHEARSPSPHGFNRICSNDLIASTTSGDWPVGAAAVKELYAAAGDTTPVGYAVYLNTGTGSGGDDWYWYERVPLDSPFPHDAYGVVADGLGNAGAPMTICVGCHAGAGSDAPHTPSVGGRDEVYTPVQ